jgi:hypothetical protein
MIMSPFPHGDSSPCCFSKSAEADSPIQPSFGLLGEGFIPYRVEGVGDVRGDEDDFGRGIEGRGFFVEGILATKVSETTAGESQSTRSVRSIREGTG